MTQNKVSIILSLHLFQYVAKTQAVIHEKKMSGISLNIKHSLHHTHGSQEVHGRGMAMKKHSFLAENSKGTRQLKRAMTQPLKEMALATNKANTQ